MTFLEVNPDDYMAAGSAINTIGRDADQINATLLAQLTGLVDEVGDPAIASAVLDAAGAARKNTHAYHANVQNLATADSNTGSLIADGDHRAGRTVTKPIN